MHKGPALMHWPSAHSQGPRSPPPFSGVPTLHNGVPYMGAARHRGALRRASMFPTIHHRTLHMPTERLGSRLIKLHMPLGRCGRSLDVLSTNAHTAGAGLELHTIKEYQTRDRMQNLFLFCPLSVLLLSANCQTHGCCRTRDSLHSCRHLDALGGMNPPHLPCTAHSYSY